MARDTTTNAALRTAPRRSRERPSTLQAVEEDREADDVPTDSKARGLRVGHDVRIAWILLMLDRGPSYGYALTRELDDHGLDVDSPATYRILRRLDDAGWVSSAWTGSSRGPQRRSYELTEIGRRALRDMAALIADAREVQDRFLKAYVPEPRRRSPSITLPPVPAVAT